MAFLGAGQDAEADQDAEPTQLFGLPEEVLMHIISFVESPADVRSALLTCRGALARAADPYLQVKGEKKSK
ncbi:hypothetical protein DUNSADRAFT_9296 [Dunaliella salina]|uniref:F-box domain-containing protein n=1 Tax=Dunaliella salina TaxID=3046 RepID=A0ABQ7GHQ7_DUNSA|nr:hypothetical protein DUNSADRAFT_9296 [Dunaliella salina]|eukprot:KAF5834135.1 hypothetical protein DUNSADRAFT_9296 [Dunaliella salina]